LSVNWIDLIVVIIIAAAVIIEFHRGFGKAIFDFVAMVLALHVSSLFYEGWAKSFHVLADKQANTALIFFVLFAVLAAILWIIGKIIYSYTLISLDTFDPPLGAALGLGVAVVICHVLMQTYYLAANVQGQPPVLIEQSWLGYEFLEFHVYHQIMDFMLRLGQ
jgi:uncharacterized membrane protein required for colicin V production